MRAVDGTFVAPSPDEDEGRSQLGPLRTRWSARLPPNATVSGSRALPH
jgi:hypothetical protein